MMVQIIVMRRGADRWTFLAHGARYSLSEAEQMRQTIERNGDRARIIDIPME